jgi:hypothetical protein
MQLHANAKLGPAGRLALVRAIESGMTQRATGRLLLGTKSRRVARPRRHFHRAWKAKAELTTDTAVASRAKEQRLRLRRWQSSEAAASGGIAESAADCPASRHSSQSWRGRL